MSVPSLVAFKNLATLLLVLTSLKYYPLNAYPVNGTSDAASKETKGFLDVTQTNISWKEFEIKFANVRQPYSLAVFPSDQNMCENASLFVFVPTRPESFSIRNAIRQTWAKDLPPRVVLKFVVGRHSRPDFVNMLLMEQKLFGDLLINDIEDTYLNLYLKIYSAFEWQQAFCSKVEYILKVDDDVIIDLNRLLFWIDNKMTPMKESQPSIIFGRLLKNNQPIRTYGRKWYVPRSLFSDSYYPPYTTGLLYLLSNQAVVDILSAAPEVKAFINEDALYTGVIAEKKYIARVDVSEHFKDGREVSNECDKATSTPLVTSIYGFSESEDFASNYQALHDLECKTDFSDNYYPTKSVN